MQVHASRKLSPRAPLTLAQHCCTPPSAPLHPNNTATGQRRMASASPVALIAQEIRSTLPQCTDEFNGACWRAPDRGVIVYMVGEV